MAVLLCVGRLSTAAFVVRSFLYFVIVILALISTFVQKFLKFSSAFSLDWRPIWFWFAAELSHRASLPAILHFRQVSTLLCLWKNIFGLYEWTLWNHLPLILCYHYFRRYLPPIRSYNFLPLILLPWIAGAACKKIFAEVGWISVVVNVKFLD